MVEAAGSMSSRTLVSERLRDTRCGGVTAELVQREYGLEIRFGDVSPHLSVSVSAPPNVATTDLIAEGGDPRCLGAFSRFTFGDITTTDRSWNWKMFIHDKVKHRVSGPETEKT